jgi:2-polyprenyl-6-methoxyphenol hydroxylase-like FAD-dependent oxidoreductase
MGTCIYYLTEPMANAIYDDEVFIAGGGPAGLAAAIAARQAGFSVTLADCAQPPIDKACGEGIMPQGVAALTQLGVSIGPGPAGSPASGVFALAGAEAYPLRGVRFFDSADGVEAHFPRAESGPSANAAVAFDGVMVGYGIRRTLLHELLVRRAGEAGVTMRWGTRAIAITAEGMSIDGEAVRGRWLVCAAGQNSRLGEQAGLAPGTPATARSAIAFARRTAGGTFRRFGFCHHYGVAPWSEFVEVYWSDCGQLYATPVAADQVCIALLTHHPRLRLKEALPQFPAVAGRLQGLQPISRALGAVTANRRLQAVQRVNLALVGDASGSVDAITGVGLTMAFQQALALAEAMRAGDLALYQRTHRCLFRTPYAMAKLMLAMDRHASLRQRAFRAFHAEPGLFTRLVDIYIGARPPISFGIRGTARLAWRLLAT